MPNLKETSQEDLTPFYTLARGRLAIGALWGLLLLRSNGLSPSALAQAGENYLAKYLLTRT